MHHVLADGGQFVRQQVIQNFDEFLVTFHVLLL
jgi:hypothetical protein